MLNLVYCHIKNNGLYHDELDMSVLISNKLQLVIQRIFFAMLGIMECVIKLQIEEFAT